MGAAAKGTRLLIGDGAASSEVFTQVAEVGDIAWGGLTLDVEETTHQTSVMEEDVATVVRGGELTLGLNHNPQHATHSTAGLLGDLQDGVDRNFRLHSPAATSTAADRLSFNAFVTAFSDIARNVTGKLAASVTLKPHTNLPTWSTIDSLTAT